MVGKLIFKSSILIVILGTTLKVDEEIDWQWAAIVWPLYIYCSFALVTSISSSLVCAGQLCSQLCKSNNDDSLIDRNDENSIALSFWLFYACNGLTLALIMTVLNLLRVLNGENESKGGIAIIPLIYLMGLIVFTLMNFKHIQRFIVLNYLLNTSTASI